ncbi:19678_t:CDS:2, partial [Dentiscutata erythropus]
TSILTNYYIKTAASSKPEMSICHSSDICMPRNGYFSESAISSAVAPPMSSDEQVKIVTYPNAVNTQSTKSGKNNNINPDENSKCKGIGSFSKSSSALKDKKTTGLPKKRKKRRLIAEAWQYFKLEENFA